LTERSLQHDRDRQGWPHEAEATITTNDWICIDSDALGRLRRTATCTYTHNDSGNTNADTAPTARVF
jgi:hypothetical protein